MENFEKACTRGADCTSCTVGWSGRSHEWNGIYYLSRMVWSLIRNFQKAGCGEHVELATDF